MDTFFAFVILIFIISLIACVIIFYFLFKARKEAILATENTDKSHFVVSRISKHLRRLSFILIPIYAIILIIILLLTEVRFPIMIILALICGISLIVQSYWKIEVSGDTLYQKSLFRPKRVFTFCDIKRVEIKPQGKVALYSDEGELFSVKKSYVNYDAFMNRLAELNIVGVDELIASRK